jgi:ring-1,2-phenylacetyl-CoA epoxidase subunit PaaD
MVSRTMPTAASVRAILEQVTDPEIPVLTIADIGILRDVAVDADGRVTVTITPTYSGCPAMEVIASDVRTALADAGYDATVATVFNPPWTTAWMSDEAKRKLAGFGIAPPGSAIDIVAEVLCPNCASSATRVIAEFSSTACKRMLVCTSCGEPFDQFKEI